MYFILIGNRDPKKQQKPFKHHKKDKLEKIEIMQLKNYYSLESNVEAEKKLKNSFNIPFIVPSKYQVNQSNETFFWASYNPPDSDEIKQILIFSFKPKSTNISLETLSKLDSIYSTFLNGAKKNSYVKIDKLPSSLLKKYL